MRACPLTSCRFAGINNPGAYGTEEYQKAKGAKGRKRIRSAFDIQAHGPAHHRYH